MASRILPIAVVARETGITKDLLRKWESRYGFPQPVRSDAGIRGYPLNQVEVLREVKRLVESGVRPGEAIRLAIDGGKKDGEGCLAAYPKRDIVQACLETIRAHDMPGLYALLERNLVSLGLREFIEHTAAPLAIAVGEKWEQGQLRIHEEQIFSATLASFLVELHRRLHLASGRPRILLTTPSGEPHTLGLDMARVLFAEAGANCILLGAQTPLAEIVQAVTMDEIEILALSFSAAYPARLLMPTLFELRAMVPPQVAIWIGGAGTLSASRLPTGVQAFVAIADAAVVLRRLAEPS